MCMCVGGKVGRKVKKKEMGTLLHSPVKKLPENTKVSVLFLSPRGSFPSPGWKQKTNKQTKGERAIIRLLQPQKNISNRELGI